MASIDPTAIIDPSAQLGENVKIGPWTLIGPDVEIDEGTVVESHAVIKGPTHIGKNNHIFQFATLGEATPDLKYQGEDTRLVIGDNNVIREGVTLHRGTVQDRSETTIGNHNLIMAYAHVGHDSVLGDHVILVNNCALAGHVHIGDWAILSGYTLVHQYVSIGAHSFTGAGTFLNQDLPAYVVATGNPAEVRTINAEGLKRRHFSSEQIQVVNRAYKVLYRQGLKLEEALTRLQDMAADHALLQPLIDSIRNSRRGILR